ncbi:thrombospondin type 1 domain-containing protein [Cryptosporidium serpentis]
MNMKKFLLIYLICIFLVIIRREYTLAQIATIQGSANIGVTNPYSFGYNYTEGEYYPLIDGDIWPMNHIVSVGGTITPNGFSVILYTANPNAIELYLEGNSVKQQIYRSCFYNNYRLRLLIVGTSLQPRIYKWPFINSWQLYIQRQEYGFAISTQFGYSEQLFWRRCLNEPVVAVKVLSAGSFIAANAVDCVVSEWSSWSSCSSTCYIGSKYRTRLIIRPRTFTGAPCPPLIDTQGCNLNVLCNDCTYSIWSEWSSCSATCSGGYQSRTRKLIWQSDITAPCDSSSSETQVCNNQDCPINCLISEWASWNLCSTTCGTGQRTRLKIILQNAQLGGLPCPSSSELIDTVPCTIRECFKMCDLKNVCKNGAACIDIPDNNFACNCTHNYYGQTCEHEKYKWWVYFLVIIATEVIITGIIKLTILNSPSYSISDTPYEYIDQNAEVNNEIFNANTDTSGIL